MPSPFPGMDPFLETPGYWQDVHSGFPLAAKAQLTPQMPPGHFAIAETEIYIHEPSADERRRLLGKPDSGVGVSAGAGKAPTAGGTALAAPPARRRLPSVYEETVKRIEIRDKFGDDVISVIELLSPVNKIRHRDAYLQKRAAILDSPVHLVEIDLLRAGERLPVLDPPACDYLVSVSRAEDRPVVDLWPLSVRDPLPTVPVPLRNGANVSLDLRVLLDAIWGVSSYAERIYRQPPDPPLSPDDAAWAAEILAGADIPLPPGFPPPAVGGEDAVPPTEPAAA